MRAPDWTGSFGDAWELPMPETKERPEHLSGVYSSLIFAPNAHPFWSHHLLSICGLWNIVGVPPAKKHYPEAKFEIGCFAINPETHKNPVDPDSGPFDLLEPADIVLQFHGVTTEQAKRLGTLFTRACVDGVLIPDSDGRSGWRVTLDETLEHLRGGHA